MGISVTASEEEQPATATPPKVVPKPRNFFQKLMKKSPVQQVYANIDIEDEGAEEHILPDNLDELGAENNAEMNAEKSSVSPSSRKSASSHVSKGSQDSGIGIISAANKSMESAQVVESSHLSSTPKRSSGGIQLQNKAWYDVPSDDDTEAPEADSLASLISHRGSSDDEN